MATSPPANCCTNEPSSAEILDTIHRLLGSRIKVTMSDGRIVSGKFSCLDRLGNIMLEDVVEQRQIAYQDVTATDAFLPVGDSVCCPVMQPSQKLETIHR